MVERGELPLSGLRVFELSIAIAAPSAGRLLHHFGADVIKVESTKNPDIIRLLGSSWVVADEDLAPFAGDTSPYLNEMMAGKRSIGLDLKVPEGMAAAKRLLATCDIFLSNYSAPAIAELGLDEESVRAVRPDIAYIVLPGFGTDPATPYYEFLAWGPNQAPLVGLDELTGYADQEPAGVATVAPPDYLSGLHAMLGALAALEQRERTAGGGTRVELSQFEATVCLLAPFLTQHALGGGMPQRLGNRSLASAPEGVYPCVGEDRWVAVSVQSDEEWRAACRVVGAVDLAELGLADRVSRHDEIDERIASWSSRRGPEDAAAALQSAGVAAHAVQDAEAVILDPQVRDRGWFLVRPSSRFGRDLFMGPPMHLRATPGDTERAGPIMAEHTDELLAELGFDAGEVDSLVASGGAIRPREPERRLHRPYDAYLPLLFPGLGAGDRSPASTTAGPPDAPGSAADPSAVTAAPGQPLAGVRVVELAGLLGGAGPTGGSGLAGGYGTMLLAGLGAEVTLVEPPAGNPLRHLPPHAPGVDAPESGLWFASFATGKRSVVIDVDSPDGRDQLRRLLASADIVVEDAGVDHYEALGLGRAALEAESPGLVWVSVTPFGLTGPKRGWKGSNLVAWAASGVLYTLGFPDRPPVLPGGPVQLAHHLASLDAAIAALLALRARRGHGRGQLVDISVAEACQWIAAETGSPLYLDDQVHRPRPGNRRPLTSPFGLYPCADGFVSFLVLQPAHWKAMSQWMHEVTGNEAVLDPVFEDIRVRYEAMEAIGEWTEDLTRQLTKLQIFEEGQRRGIPVTPVNTVADLRADPHLKATRFWREETHPALGPILGPREPFRTAPEMWRLTRAPLLGEHTATTLAEGPNGP